MKCFMLKSSEFDVVARKRTTLLCLALGAEAHTTSEGSVILKFLKKFLNYFNLTT